MRMRERGDAIDVLVNNAGIYPPARRVVTPDGHELTFAIAHLGHFRLTHALWPLLAQAKAARVVSVSSMVRRHARLDLDDLASTRAYEPIMAYQRANLSCLMFAQIRRAPGWDMWCRYVYLSVVAGAVKKKKT